MSLTKSRVSDAARIRWRSHGDYVEGRAPRRPATRYTIHGLHPGHGLYVNGTLTARAEVRREPWTSRRAMLNAAQAHADEDAR